MTGEYGIVFLDASTGEFNLVKFKYMSVATLGSLICKQFSLLGYMQSLLI